MTRNILICIAILALTVSTAAAQARKRSTKPAAAAAASLREIQQGAERIAAEAKILSTFLYRYGGVVKGIEASEKAATDSGSPPALVEQVGKSKAAVAASVRNLVVGMQELESYLGLSASTKPYFDHVNGLADDIDLAADTAQAGKLDAAGEKLLVVLDQLTLALVPAAEAK